MSIHKSLKTKTKQNRTVRKRFERFKTLKEKGINPTSVLALPKEKIIKLKIKKEKKEKKDSLIDITISPLETTKVKKQSRDVGKIK